MCSNVCVCGMCVLRALRETRREAEGGRSCHDDAAVYSEGSQAEVRLDEAV